MDSDTAERLGRLDGRLTAVEHRLDALPRNGNGNGGLTKAERIALITGAPVVLAALIAALVQLVQGGAA